MTVRLEAFTATEHEPFYWRAGPHAALLIHGFPGTPAEMRPAAETLLAAGWSVQGLLLPGFGAEFATLSAQRHTDWMAAVDNALTTLARDHASVLLVGNSMGGALALRAAAHRPVAGLVLFAPFWRVNPWLDAVYPLAARLFSRVRPFRRADFADPRFRQALRQFMPDVDLDDAAVQAAVRELALPVHVLGQVRRSGQLGYRFAAQVQAPVLILQGSQDPLVKPARTRQLAARLPKLAALVELPGEHDLVRAGGASWEQAAAAILAFAQQVTGQPGATTPKTEL